MTLSNIKFGKLSIVLMNVIGLSLPIIIHLYTLEKSVAEQPNSQPSKLAQLAYFQGNWVCQVQDIGTTASELAGEMTWNVVKQTDRQSYRIQGTYVRSRERSKKISTQGLMTYDAMSERFIQSASSNDGSRLIFNSIGWQGEKFVWQGAQTRQEGDYVLRRTIMRKSERKFEAAYAALNPTNSRWYPVAKLICTKS